MQEQTAYKPEAQGDGDGRNPSDVSRAASTATARRESYRRRHDGVIEAVVETKNMWEAYRRVVKNKGAPGVDGMTVDDLGGYLKTHWTRIKRELLEGVYKPGAVRKVEIPKPNGGKRRLGIPTVMDRLIQQAVHQALEPIFDPEFSPHSYGFRRGRSTHDADCAENLGQEAIEAGSAVPPGRNHGGRDGNGENRRDTTRESVIAATVKHHAR